MKCNYNRLPTYEFPSYIVKVLQRTAQIYRFTYVMRRSWEFHIRTLNDISKCSWDMWHRTMPTQSYTSLFSILFSATCYFIFLRLVFQIRGIWISLFFFIPIHVYFQSLPFVDQEDLLQFVESHLRTSTAKLWFKLYNSVFEARSCTALSFPSDLCQNFELYMCSCQNSHTLKVIGLMTTKDAKCRAPSTETPTDSFAFTVLKQLETQQNVQVMRTFLTFRFYAEKIHVFKRRDVCPCTMQKSRAC